MHYSIALGDIMKCSLAGTEVPETQELAEFQLTEPVLRAIIMYQNEKEGLLGPSLSFL
jgi:hypothetical protein